MKIIYPRVCGIDVHKKFLSQLSAFLNPSNPSTLKKDSQPSITSSFNSGIGLLKTTVKMYAWNQPASTISLYTMH